MRKLIGIMVLALAFTLSAFTPQALAGTAPTLTLEAPNTVTTGDTFEVKVNLSNALNIEGLDLKIKYDPTILQVLDSDEATSGVQVSKGPLLEGIIAVNNVDTTQGMIRLVAAKGDPGISGTGVIAVLKLKAISGGTGSLDFLSAKLVDRSLNWVTCQTSGSTLTISSPSVQLGISGKVTAADGTPLEKIDVNIYDFTSEEFIAWSTTDTNGQYSVEVPAGTYKVEFSTYFRYFMLRDYYMDQWYSGQGNSDQAQHVTVTDSALTNMNAVLDKWGLMTGLTAQGVSENQIQLTWQALPMMDEPNNVLRYDIYRSDSQNGTYTLIDAVNSPTTSYIDGNLDPAASYWYKVKGVSLFGEGPLSDPVTASLIPQVNLSGEPSLRLGLSPEDQESVGILVGLKDIKDSAGKAYTGTLSSFKFEIHYDPSKLSWLEAINKTGQGHFEQTLDQTSKTLTISTDGLVNLGNDKTGELVFIPLVVTGSAKDGTSVSLQFLEAKAQDGSPINLPATLNQGFQRGKILNQSPTAKISIKDVIAGLQYLAGLRAMGLNAGEVNTVNMASTNPAESTSLSPKASISNVVAILQYLSLMRDETFTTLQH